MKKAIKILETILIVIIIIVGTLIIKEIISKMTQQEQDQSIEQLKTQVSELQQKLTAAQNYDVGDPNFKSAVERSSDSFMSSKIFDLAWKKTIHFITFFESIDGYSKTTSGGTITLDGNQIQMQSGATSGNYALLEKGPTYQGLLTFSQDSNMRTTITVDQTTNQTAYILMGALNAGYGGYGFKIVDDKIYGVANNGTSETTVLLQTISTSNYTLEARYVVGKSVVFLINNVEKGVVNATLPSQASVANPNLLTIKITTAANADKVMHFSFFEYMQYRNILN